MKKIILSILIIIFFFPKTLYSQVEIKHKPGTWVHWFYIRAAIKIDGKNHIKKYDVRKLGNTIKSGKIEDYEDLLWRYINRGNQLAVGPFTVYEDAKRALKMYNLARKTDEQMQKEIELFKQNDSTANENCYFFYLEFSITERTHRYEFKRIPNFANPRTVAEFKEVLWEGLINEKLAIGPFPSNNDALAAMFIYKQEEKSDKKSKREIRRENRKNK